MRKSRRLALLFVMFLIILSSCGSPAATEAPQANEGASAPAPAAAQEAEAPPSTDEVKYQKTIQIAPSLAFTSMDVQNDAGGTAKGVYLLVFNTLVEKDTLTMEYVPGLALSWEQKEPTLWEFKLREGVKYHDGSPFTAKDVKFSIERGMTQGATKSKLPKITEVIIVDDYTVQFKLAAPDNDLVYKFTEPNTVIICASAFETMPEEEAIKIGTGPYKYDEWVQGDHLKLVRFDDYWDGPRKTEELIFRTIPEAATRLIALQTGEVDFIVDPPAVDLHYVEQDANLRLTRINSSTIRFLTFNVLVPPLDNPKVREALMYAFDREALVALVYEGNATPHFNVMHTMSEFYVDSNTFSYDPEKAKALLAEAGYPDGFKTTIYSSSGSVQKAVANVIQAQLREIGVEAEVQSLEVATFNAGIAPGGTFPIHVDGWGGHTIGPDNALRTIFHSDGGMNRSNCNDPETDGMIDAALSEADPEKRFEMYRELQSYLLNKGVFIPLAIEQINVATKATLEGFEPPDGLFHHWRNLYIVEK